MATAEQNLHVFFFPLFAQGHIIPMIDMARLFAQRGLVTTIITTPHNTSRFKTTIDRARDSGLQIGLLQLQFPCSEAGLPEGCENVDALPSLKLLGNFLNATQMLQDPFEQLIGKHRPSFIVSDWFLPWTVDIASKFNIPRLAFLSTSTFAFCCSHNLHHYKPHEILVSDSESFVVPGLPDQIEITRSQMPDYEKIQTTQNGSFQALLEAADRKSFGTVLNSFYELEPAYIDHYRSLTGLKAWPIGPVSFCNKQVEDKAERGKQTSIDQNKCLNWLDSNKPRSVLYVCFGSLCNISATQLLEIALSLEASKHPFIWVIKSKEVGECLPKNFQERIGMKGLIIRGWAPQILILGHPATGGFMTHCGWNSSLEAVSAGVPLITWPLFGEQFYNEKLIVKVLRIGIRVGNDISAWIDDSYGTLVKREEIEKVVDRLMGSGEEGNGLRKRAKDVGEMARRAMEEGGSSHLNMSLLIQDLRTTMQETGRE